MRTLKLLVVLGISFASSSLGLGTAEASSGRCYPLHGRFTSTPVAGPDCASPVGFCTEGQLTGSLRGSYSFVMDTSVPSDARVPGVQTFTGVSEVTTRRGATLTGIDTGTIDLSPDRNGNLASIITFTETTGHLAGASAQIALRGSLDFASGEVSGTYRGELCF